MKPNHYCKMLRKNHVCAALLIYTAMLSQNSWGALEINEKLTGKTSTYDWTAIDGACLTAGSGTSANSRIPGCIGLPYYSGKKQVGGKTGQMVDGTPDKDGEGALRLTNGDTALNGINGNNQRGAVYSNFSFPSNAGVDITFKTVTYGGNGFQNSISTPRTGADGIVFFLVDDTQLKDAPIPKDPVTNTPTKIGAYGGSLGYSCSQRNAPPDGIYAGYLGLGIDEFGNYANQGDNTSTGIASGFTPNTVSLRGAGNTNWATLSTKYPQWYPAGIITRDADRQNLVTEACKTGQLKDYSAGPSLGRTISVATQPKDFYNYRWIASKQLGSLAIYSQEGTPRPTRDNAKPITYNLKITQNGLLSLSYKTDDMQSVSHVLENQNITSNNGPLPKAFRFGFSAGTGGGSNVHEIMCFKASQISGSESSAEGNVPTGGRVQAGSQLYLAMYHPQGWWGQLTAQSLVENTSDGSISINPVAKWDGNCTLTGGECKSTQNANGVTATTAAQSGRKIITWNGTQGVTFDYGNLTAGQLAALGAGSGASSAASTLASDYVNYLKGDRSKEIKTDGTGVFRARQGLLGDIINSSPTWVGNPQSPYTATWKDLRYPSQTAAEGSTSYSQYASTKATRTHVVYVGSNDGFLHGFKAGKNDDTGTFVDNYTTNNGAEVLAYMPSQIIKTIGNPSSTNTSVQQLSFGNTSYSHTNFVDAVPGVGDLYVQGKWQTWLAGGLGAGGNVDASGNPAPAITNSTDIGTGAFYLLDITNPDDFSTATPNSIVLGEWTSNDLVCLGDTANSKCRDSLGNVRGTPLIRRLHNGNWAVIIPNGQNSKSGKSGIFIMLIDPDRGDKTFKFLPAGDPQMQGTTITARNGITQVTAADLDRDHITDYVYAGDMLGNIWRFDLTSNDPANWAVNTPAVFNAGQPISSAIVVSSAYNKGKSRLMLNFGTGKIYGSSQTANATYALYGLWDSNMTAWNSASATKYETLSGTATTIAATDLVGQTATAVDYVNELIGISGIRTISNNAVCWKGSTDCTTNNAMGWKLPLPGTNEQVVYNPTFQNGMFVVNTTIPEVDQALSCDTKPASGYTFAIVPDTGSTASENYIIGTQYTGGIIGAVGTSGVGSLMNVNTGDRTFLVTQTTTGAPKVLEVNPSLNITAKRVTWMRRR